MQSGRATLQRQSKTLERTDFQGRNADSKIGRENQTSKAEIEPDRKEINKCMVAGNAGE